ncbi:hypothetical protein E4U21_005416 [Claviceps maximensis]|nr:hypothetical protein E4U21_005416 [Claviceps maximensis]
MGNCFGVPSEPEPQPRPVEEQIATFFKKPEQQPQGEESPWNRDYGETGATAGPGAYSTYYPHID